ERELRAVAAGAGRQANQETRGRDDEACAQSRIRTGCKTARRNPQIAPRGIRCAGQTGRLSEVPMANDPGQTEIADSEKTDTLPTLDSDGAPLDRAVPTVAKPALIRGAAFDLPRLDETVRSVEERIARQDAELAGFARRLERAHEAEAAAI